MSYGVRRIDCTALSGSSGDNPPPTTATVLGYICLFTHDLKRKQKRWQDGKLKYHMFNKRIMVYDDRGNFIGDSHWHAGGHLQEGEELELDRGAAIVQVADFVDSREQDLTQLLDKRAREVEKRRAVAAANTPEPRRPRPQQPREQTQGQPRVLHFQTAHRPLSSIVPSPGPIGRAAIPARSPYEARKAGDGSEQQATGAPPAKKRRSNPSPPSKTGFAQNLFGARLNLSASSMATSTLKTRPLQQWTNVQTGWDASRVERASAKENSDANLIEERSHTTSSVDGHRLSKDLPKARGPAFREQAERTRNEESAMGSEATRAQAGLIPIEERTRRVENERSCALSRTVPRQAPEHPLANKFCQSAKEMAEPESTALSTTEQIPRCISILEAQDSAASRTQVVARESAQPMGNIAHEITKDALACKTTGLTSQTAVSAPAQRERRTELRIKSRQRRGLLVVSERKQGEARNSASATSTPSVQPTEGNEELSRPSTPLARSAEEITSEQAVQVTQESITTSSPKSSPIHQQQHKQHVSDAEHAHMEPTASINNDPGVAVDRQAPGNTPIYLPDDDDDDDDDAADVAPQVRDGTPNPGRDASPHSPSTAEKDDATPPHEKANPLAQIAISASASVCSDTESDDAPHIRSRQRRGRVRSRQSSPVPSDNDRSQGAIDELPVERARPKRRTSRQSDMADCPPAKRTKRQKSKLSNDLPVDVSAEHQRPRISRLASKSVKSKEIFGFFPAFGVEQLQKAPFAMAGPRIGTIGRPPSAPIRPPGITLTKILEQERAPTSTRLTQESTKVGHVKKAAETSTQDPIMHHDAAVAKAQSQAAAPIASRLEEASAGQPKSLPIQTSETLPMKPVAERVSDAPKPNITNPATRGKKAARKEDAAGQAPQHIVPFEPPQPIRTLPKTGAAVLKENHLLPGFSKANGGAWSKHAEDLLGMTRPCGKRPQ